MRAPENLLSGALLKRRGFQFCCTHSGTYVLTLGLWEVVETPTEAAFDGTEMAYEVRYDTDGKVDQVVALKKK